MENDSEKIYKEIREILAKNKDAQKGFSSAAENTDNLRLQTYFRRKSYDREGFNDKLLEAIHAGYPNIKVEGSFTGTIHRVWMDMKTMFTADDDESLLNEAIRGDKAAVEEYDEVLNYKSLPIELRHLLNEQRESIIIDLRNNSTLEDIE